MSLVSLMWCKFIDNIITSCTLSLMSLVSLMWCKVIYNIITRCTLSLMSLVSLMWCKVIDRQGTASYYIVYNFTPHKTH
jgi:hypothetical protein